MTRLLGGMDAAAFLARHWQKEPLLVRGAIPDFESPLEPEELAGLACDEDVTSRLVLERGGERPWQVRHGPFKEEDFTGLGEGGWSLMVQEVDQLVPAVDDLLQLFRFVPNWRIDDVMVSFAPPGASVGAHVDNYDVFLFQGKGRRRWQIQREPVAEEHLVPGLDVRMLADFQPDDEWVLEPGDMLYLPPRIAHHGVAVDACMTFSIGFASPDAGELFTAFLTTAIEDSLADDADETDPLARVINRRYADPDLAEQAEPGEIAAAARRRVHGMLRDVLADESAFDRWLGRFLTVPHRIPPRPPEDPIGDVARALREGGVLLRSAVAHFAHTEIDGATYLYVGGTEHPLASGQAALAPVLSGRRQLDHEALLPFIGDAAATALLSALIDDGFLELRKPD